MNIARALGLAAPVAAVLLIAPGHSRAAYIPLESQPTLSQLLGTDGSGQHNYTTVADKTFTFLSYSSTTINASSIGLTSLSQTANGIVTPYGFQLGGSFSASGVNASGDVALNYTVTSSGPPITAINLFANASTTGSGFADVTEDVFTLNANGSEGTFLGQISANSANPTASLNLGAGYSGLYVTKDIDESTGASGGSGTISIVQQTFPTVVPEPASVAMLGLGLAGAFGFARPRRKAVVA